jgi:hypothetical protein
VKLFGTISVDFEVTLITGQIFCIHQVLEKKLEYNKTVHQLFLDLKKAYDSVRGEVLYNIVIEFGFPVKLVSVVSMEYRL